MKKVVNANLSGNAFQIEEQGFDALGDYLEDARANLAGNPDLEEIMTDLEQSIADKMSRFLSKTKTVVTTTEIEQIIAEMGPVDSDDAAAEATASTDSAETDRAERSSDEAIDRKLYKLTGEGEKMLTGVCAGLAAYFGVDPIVIRIAFVALTFATSGVAIFAYLILALVMPTAQTPQQHAAAYGAPFDAKDVIDRARSSFDEFKNSRRFREQRRAWRRRARDAGFDDFGSILGLVVVLFGILVGLWLLSRIFFWLGSPMYIGPAMGNSIPWGVTIIMVIVGVYLVGWIFGDSAGDASGKFRSVLVKTVKVCLILLLIFVALQVFAFATEPVQALMYTVSAPFR